MSEEDKCSKCGEEITQENYISEYESRGEYWGAPCSECVVTGYACPNCGHKGDF